MSEEPKRIEQKEIEQLILDHLSKTDFEDAEVKLSYYNDTGGFIGKSYAKAEITAKVSNLPASTNFDEKHIVCIISSETGIPEENITIYGIDGSPRGESFGGPDQIWAEIEEPKKSEKKNSVLEYVKTLKAPPNGQYNSIKVFVTIEDETPLMNTTAIQHFFCDSYATTISFVTLKDVVGDMGNPFELTAQKASECNFVILLLRNSGKSLNYIEEILKKEPKRFVVIVDNSPVRPSDILPEFLNKIRKFNDAIIMNKVEELTQAIQAALV